MQFSSSAEVKQQLRTNQQWENYSDIYFYIQMELCEDNLDKYLLKRNCKLYKLIHDKAPEVESYKQTIFQEAIQILQQIIEGTNHLHSQYQLVHRDLKPKNIFLTQNH